ncbi:4814_t:CDS:2, partial [Gigaspora rosea]
MEVEIDKNEFVDYKKWLTRIELDEMPSAQLSQKCLTQRQLRFLIPVELLSQGEKVWCSTLNRALEINRDDPKLTEIKRNYDNGHYKKSINMPSAQEKTISEISDVFKDLVASWFVYDG